VCGLSIKKVGNVAGKEKSRDTNERSLINFCKKIFKNRENVVKLESELKWGIAFSWSVETMAMKNTVNKASSGVAIKNIPVFKIPPRR
jgi:hypothetical protein